MRISRGILAVLAVLALLAAAALGGCAGSSDEQPDPTVPAESPGGTYLGPGLYDQADGSALAIGILEYKDLEGGFWAVTDNTMSTGGGGEVVAVIANGSDFEAQLSSLEGRLVEVSGTRSEGVSTRMAGPEIVMDSITDITDRGGPAE